MERIKIFGFTGSVLMLIGIFLPIAALNGNYIAIMPVWNDSGNVLWSWRDISFFAVTFVIITMLSFFFSNKKIKAGLIISSVLAIFVLIMIFITIIHVGSKISSYDNMSLNLSWGWIPAALGAVLVLMAGLKKEFNNVDMVS